MQNKTTQNLFFSAVLIFSAVLGQGPKAHALSLEEARWITGDAMFKYHQDKLDLKDPGGDLLLLRIVHGTPLRILQVKLGLMSMVNNNPAPVSAAEISDACKKFSDKLENCNEGPKSLLPYVKPIEGRVNPIQRESFAKMLTQVIAEESNAGINPVVGTPHVWTPEVEEQFGHNPKGEGYGTLLVFPKILLALSHGMSHRFMSTGQEAALAAWINKQAVNSVTHDLLFRQSYRLNNGNVYLSILTIENLLSHRWRYPNREDLPITKRLQRFTNFYGKVVDNFGSWYHLYGMMLYSYVYGENSGVRVAKLEHLGSKILDGDSEPQELWMNISGAWLGADLRKIVESQAHLTHKMDKELLSPFKYLNREEDYRDRLPLVQDASLEVTASREGLQIKNLGSDLSDCILTVMVDQGRGFNSLEKIVRDPVAIAQEQSFKLTAEEIRTVTNSNRTLKGAKVFLNFCRPSPYEKAAELKP